MNFSPAGALLVYGDLRWSPAPEFRPIVDLVVRDLGADKEVARIENGMLGGPSAFTSDGTRFVARAEGNVFCVYDTKTWKVTEVLPVSIDVWSDAGGALALSPDGKLVAFAGWKGVVEVWEFEKKARVGLLPGHKDHTRAMAFSPDGKTLVTVTGFDSRGVEGRWPADGEIHVWDVATQKRTFKDTAEGSLLHVSFAPDGKRVVAAGSHGATVVWDVAAGKKVVVLDPVNKKEMVHAARFSPSGKRVVAASGSSHPAVRVWDAATGKVVATVPVDWELALAGHLGPDTRYLSLSEVRGTRIWDLRTE